MKNKQPQTFQDAFDLIAKELKNLMILKQKDYGKDNITAFGELGCLVRCSDKVNRIKNLVLKNKQPLNEVIDDSWQDLANYAIIALMLRKNLFRLPLKD